MRTILGAVICVLTMASAAGKLVFESEAVKAHSRNWLIERYCQGDASRIDRWLEGGRRIVLDAGCGAGFSALLFFGDRLRGADYLGVDISDAVEIARERFREAGVPGDFLQCSLMDVPIPEASVDMVAANLRLLDNQIAVEVTNAHQALVAAYQRAVLAGEQLGLTQELAEAEVRRFQLGGGDMLEVNLRELATAEAAAGEVRSVADYFIAKATLEVAKGEGVHPVQP